MNIVLGIIGLLLVSYAIWIKKERKQNYLFIIGGIFLFLYSFHIKDWIFAILQIIFMLSAGIEIYKKR